jgi:hypothetical protein
MNNKLFVDIDALTNKFNAKVNGAMDKLQNFGDKATMVGGALSIAITVPVLLAARQAIAAASNVEEAQNKVNVAFKTSSGVIHEFAKDSLTNFGISSGAALDAAALFGDMATSMGINTGQAAEMSKTLVGLAGDLSSFKNIRIDVAETALKSIFTGETESLKGLGIVMTEANLKAFALSEGIQKNIRDMTESEKVNLRYAFVMAKTTNAQGDFARTSDGAANQTRILEESIKQLSAGFGERLLPMYAKVLQSVNKVITYFDNLDGGTKDLILQVAGLAAAIGPLLLGVGGVIQLMPVLTLGFAALTGPIGLTVGALTLAGVAIYKYVDDWEKGFARIHKAYLQLDLVLAGIFNDRETVQIDTSEIERLNRIIDRTYESATKLYKSPAFDFLRGGQKAFAGMGANIPTVADPKPINPLAGFGKKTLKEIEDELAANLAANEAGILAYRLKLEKGFNKLKATREKIAKSMEGLMVPMLAKEIPGISSNYILDPELGKIFNQEVFNNNLNNQVEAIKTKIKGSVEDIKISFTEDMLLFDDFSKAVVDASFMLLGDVFANSFASAFNQDIKFDFSQLLGGFFAAIGAMMMEMAIKLEAIATIKDSAVAALNSLAPGAGIAAAALLFVAGAALKGGGMAMSANTNSNSQISSPRQGGGSFGGSSGFTMPTLNLNINGVLKGNGTELQAVLNNTQYSWNG